MSLARLQLCANIINKNYDHYTLLDAGCRTMDLKPLLTNCDEYFGSDLIAGDGVLQCNLEETLPFENNSFDIVTALDVIEHLNNPHFAMSELIRVAKKGIIISLPNMYYIEFRLRFLTGGGISGKYNFSPIPILDRHRWILSYEEAIEFIKENCQGYEFNIYDIYPVRGRTKLISEPLQRKLAEYWPNLFKYGVMFYLPLIK